MLSTSSPKTQAFRVGNRPSYPGAAGGILVVLMCQTMPQLHVAHRGQGTDPGFDETETGADI